MGKEMQDRLRRVVSGAVVSLLLPLLAVTLTASGTSGAKRSGTHPAAEFQAPIQPQGLAAYSRLPVAFEANQGQADRAVRFLSRGRGYTLFLTDSEAVLVLVKSPGRTTPTIPRLVSPDGPDSSDATVLRMKLVGANVGPRMAGVERLPGTIHHLIGDDSKKWQTNIPTYAKVRYQAIYPGVDLIYHGAQGQLEYDFVLAPGANPDAITLDFRGADRLEVDAHGDLVVRIRGGEVRLHRPHVYQEVDGLRRPVSARYVLKNRDRVGFHVAAYDVRQSLVIDPVLGYSTYLGGSGNDQALGIAVDGSGNAYVTGKTLSTNFPSSASGFQKTLGGKSDVFVTKLNTNASGPASLVYSTYVGGSQDDVGNAIALDSSCLMDCAVYVTGQTFSTANFPAKPLKSGSRGVSDAFVFKLKPDGSGFIYSVYLGGSGDDAGLAMAVDSGNAYVTGFTTSSNFPATAGAYDTTLGGGQDAYVAKLNANGTALDYATYLGGTGNDVGMGIAVNSGAVYVTGFTASSNFPTTAGTYDPTLGGGQDAFVAKLNANGTALAYSTYLGGTGDDTGMAIALNAGTVYVTGFTTSPNFPTTTGAHDITLGGGQDAFVTKLTPAGFGAADLVYSTFLGGSSNDAGHGIAVDSLVNVYVAGETASSDFPTMNAFRAVFSGPTGVTDAFVAKLGLNTSPRLTSPGNKVVDEGQLLTFTLSATDVDGQTITYSISGGFQSGMSLNASTGVFTWTPSEAQGQGTYGVTFRATDTLGAFDEKTITITVNEVNQPPVLGGVPAAATIPELVPYTFTATATDSDIPVQTLTFSLVGAPAGAAIGAASGVFTWTPTEAQGLGTYPFTVRVTDGVVNTDASITLTVTEVNSPPVLAGVPAAATIPELVPYTFTATATDSDIPVQTLTFSLVGAPAGAAIGAASGVFTWTPTEAQGPGTYPFTVRVSDGVANTDASITLTVTEVNTAPLLTVAGGQTVDEGKKLTFIVSATDSDLPTNTLTLSASNLPTGATFDPVTRTFSWTPTSAQGGPQPYLVYFTVSDGQFVDTKLISITVNDTIVDTDGDGVPDPPGYDLDGNGVISPPGVRNSQGQFEQDNCPEDYNPDQADVCHNSPETASAVSLVAASGSATGPLNVTLNVTFTGGTTGIHVLPVNLFNSICRLIDNATGQQAPVKGVPEGPPINLSPSTDGGDLVFVPGGSSVQTTTTFDLKLFYPNLAEGSYTILCDYVNFAHDPQGDAPGTWMGKLSAPAQTVYNGEYVFSGFFSPADHEPFNRGRTVPVKFTLATSSGVPVTTATVKLFVQQLDGGGNPVGSPIPATSNDASIGNVVPYNAAGGQYQYNMRTNPLAIGLWQLQVQLDDGTTKVITIIIR